MKINLSFSTLCHQLFRVLLTSCNPCIVGGYGTVYKAQRKNDGKIFAVKCMINLSYPL